MPTKAYIVPCCRYTQDGRSSRPGTRGVCRIIPVVNGSKLTLDGALLQQIVVDAGILSPQRAPEGPLNDCFRVAISKIVIVLDMIAESVEVIVYPELDVLHCRDMIGCVEEDPNESLDPHIARPQSERYGPLSGWCAADVLLR